MGLQKRGSDVKAQELCLDVISCYVDWIDIELIVNDTMIPLIIGDILLLTYLYLIFAFQIFII